MRKLSLLAVAALAVAAAGLSADEPRRTGGDEKFSDKMFVEKAAIGGMFEVKSSQLAEQKGMNPQVKQFAQHMVTDHTKANQELMALAQRKGWHMPTALDQKHQDMINRLQTGGAPAGQPAAGGTGAAAGQFDRTYIDMQLKAHEKTVQLFQTASQQCQDADLKAWAAKTLPTLQEHEREVKQLAQGHTGSGTRTVPPK